MLSLKGGRTFGSYAKYFKFIFIDPNSYSYVLECVRDYNDF